MNQEKCFSVYKHIGETPLEALERVRISKGLDPLLPMTYAGRLDPMAEGVLLILVGEECKKKEQYLGLNKVYEVEVLLGFETDTGDLLGKVKSQNSKSHIETQKAELEQVLKSLEGKFVQEYPAFSSKTVNGEPLFAYAKGLVKSGNLPETLPTKEVEIFGIDLLEQREVSSKVLLDYILENIAKVKGDFRQEEILSLWRDVLQGSQDSFQIAKIKVSCSSGTYMRSLAESIGRKLGCFALAYSIKRTRVGEFGL